MRTEPKKKKTLLMGLLGISFGLVSSQAIAVQSVRTCVSDPAGQQGPLYQTVVELELTARKWGVQLERQLYVNEEDALNHFNAGNCDAIFLTSLQARPFVPFAGSIDAVGGLRNYEQVAELIRLLANPKVEPLLSQGDFEAAGVIPLGGAYVMVNDRRINSVENLAGKRIAVLEWDSSQTEMARILGTIPVKATVRDYFMRFNTGEVDMMVSPAVAFQPLELHKGLGKKGGIYQFPLINLTATLLIRKSKVNQAELFAQKMRQHIALNIDGIIASLKKLEQEIPSYYWMVMEPEANSRYQILMREVRLLLAHNGVYDRRMMRVLKRIRCKQEPNHEECRLKDE